MGNEAKICRICLKNCVTGFSAIVENTIEMLHKLLLKTNLFVTDEPVMCLDCEEKIKTFFSFKSTCLYTEDYIISFASDKEDKKVNLKDVYLSNKKYENATDILEDCAICRFCMEILRDCSFIRLDEENKDVVLEKIMCEKCLPEMDISVTKRPVICSLCHKHLQNYYNFMMNCFQVEEMINKYYKSVINRQGLIKLQDVFQFSTKNMCENSDTVGDISDIEDKSNEEKANQVEVKFEHIKLEIRDQEFKGPLQCSLKNMFGTKDDETEVDESEIKNMFCVKEEIKIEQEEKSLMETESQPFVSCEEDEIKMDYNDLNSFHDIVLAEPEELFKSERCLSPVANTSSSSTSLCSNFSETKMFKCECCPYQTKHKHALKMHILVHKDASEITMFKCECCPHQTRHRCYLKTHMLIHKDTSETTMFICDSCLYQTKRKGDLKIHMLTHKDPSEVTIFKCKCCPFQTKYERSLKKHILVHKDTSEITIFKCECCPFQTKHKISLKNHMLQHKDISEVTMFKCECCQYKTKYKYNLKKHMLMHKDTSEITMFKCECCPFWTKRKGYLKRHMLIHKDTSEVTMFKCECCPFQTKIKTYLKHHMLVHKDTSQVIMFKCASCPYQTKHKQALKQHILTHKGRSEVTMLKCEYCPFQTKHRRFLKKHIPMKHKHLQK